MKNVPALAIALLAFSLAGHAQTTALRISTVSPLPSGTAGIYYVQKLAATGGTPPYRWAEAPSVTSGLTLSAAGVLSGTPTLPGDAAFTAQVTDAAGATAFKVFSMTVNPAALVIATPSPLADGVQGSVYLQSFAATGGKQPITWTAQGTLPPGLIFSSDGTLAGTPTAAGAYSFGVTAAGAEGSKATATYQLAINRAGPAPVLSAGSLSFIANVAGTSPPVQSITVSSAIDTSLPFAVNADVPWITVSPAAGFMPGAFDVNVRQGTMPAGNYTGTIGIRSPSLNPNSPVLLTTIPVSLQLTAVPPALAVSPQEVSRFRIARTPSSLLTTLLVSNAGSGPVDFRATLVDFPGAASVTPVSGTVNPNAKVPLALSIDIPALQAGYYRSRVQIDWDGGSVSTLIKLFVAPRPKLFISANGSTSYALDGVGMIGPAAKSFSLLASGAIARYTVQSIDNPGWLTLNSSAGIANDTAQSAVNYTINPAGLKPGVYYAHIRVSSPDAVNSPHDFLVILAVLREGLTPVVDLAPAGLLFVAGGSSPPASQNIQVFGNTGKPVPFGFSASTDDGGDWLSAQATALNASATVPGRIQVSVDPSRLKPGIYHGRIRATVGLPIVRGALVTLVVPPSGSTAGGPSATPAAGCSGSSMAISQTVLQDTFQVFAHWPWFISVNVVDDCGNPVPNATVVAHFSNGDPDLSLDLNDPLTGKYSDAWYPDHTSLQTVVTITATAAGLGTATATLGGRSDSNSDVPSLRADGPLHIFNPRTGDPLAPGTIIQLYGSALSNAAGPPTVVIGGIPAQVLYSASGQINAQLPLELDPAHEYLLSVAVGSAYTEPKTLVTVPYTPGIAALLDGSVIAQHANYSLVTGSAPAQACETVQTYLAGLGPTTAPLRTGDPAPSNPLAFVSTMPAVKVNGVSADVSFAGLTPGLFGLYQINFTVPPGVPAGDLKLDITQEGVLANTSLLSVGSQSLCK